MGEDTTIETLREAAQALRSGSDLDAVRAIQTAQNALDAAKADRLRTISETHSHELEGASSLTAWTSRHLRLNATETRALVAATEATRELPAVADAAAHGRLRLQHVSLFTYGLRHVGREVVTQSEDWLLDVALEHEPGELRTSMRALREYFHPDELDRAWADGMEKQDIKVDAVPSGWHVNGFLGTEAGAKLRAVLDSLGAPRDKDDERTGAERRVDALETMLDGVLENGLPSDRGVRPHLSVIADLATVEAALAGRASETSPPAQLAGFGSIGPQLLGKLLCGADITTVYTDGDPQQARVLNVGRSHRLATLKQRRAVKARQHDECAAPGCHATHLEMHHSVWWSHGGPTDLDALVGLCPRCHHLIHRGLLHVAADGRGGFLFTDHDNRALLRGHRQRQTLRREAWRIGKIAARREQRFRSPMTVVSRT
jgi:hypothetical protein